MPETRVCRDCGASLADRHPLAQRCQPCVVKREKERVRLAVQAHRQRRAV